MDSFRYLLIIIAIVFSASSFAGDHWFNTESQSYQACISGGKDCQTSEFKIDSAYSFCYMNQARVYRQRDIVNGSYQYTGENYLSCIRLQSCVSPKIVDEITGQCVDPPPPPEPCPPQGEKRTIAVCGDSKNESNGTLNIKIDGNAQKTANFEGCVYNYQSTDFLPDGAGGAGCYVPDNVQPVDGKYEVCCVFNGTSSGMSTTSPDSAKLPESSPTNPVQTSDDGKCKTDSNGNQVCATSSPSSTQQCGTVNGAKVCVDSDVSKPSTINDKPIDLQGKNCVWVNGVLKCVDDSPSSPTTEGCVVGWDGRTYCVNRDVNQTTTETTIVNPDGSITTTKTTDKNIIGDDPDTETTTTNPDGSKTTTKSGDDGQGTSDCEKNPNTLGCQDLGKGTVPSSDPIPHYDVPITWNYTSFGSGGSCPADIPALTQINASWSFQPVCDFASGLRPILVALAFLLAGRIVLGGIKE